MKCFENSEFPKSDFLHYQHVLQRHCDRILRSTKAYMTARLDLTPVKIQFDESMTWVSCRFNKIVFVNSRVVENCHLESEDSRNYKFV